MPHKYSLGKKKDAFESVPLSRQSIMSRNRETAGNLELHLKDKEEITTFFFFLSLEECCDVTYKAQSPLSCMWKDFKVMKELAVLFRNSEHCTSMLMLPSPCTIVCCE